MIDSLLDAVFLVLDMLAEVPGARTADDARRVVVPRIRRRVPAVAGARAGATVPAPPGR